MLTTALLLAALTPSAAPAPACEGTCVRNEDLATFIQVLKEKQCLQHEKPSFELDPVTLTVDKDGRVFYSGAQPKPYTLKMNWCNYEVTAEGKLDVIVALQEPPTWGFRFRPKAYLGYALAEPLRKDGTFSDGIDAGLMVDFFFWEDFNLNGHVGARAFGLGLGADLTENFGVTAGYALSWDGFRSNPEVAFTFAF